MSKVSSFRYNGFTFQVYPTVFHPALFFSSRIFARFISKLDLTHRKVLDIGTGSGILAVVAAARGAEVVAVDKNPEAVKCTHYNVRINGLGKRVKIFQGDLFQPLDQNKKFDYIFFNPPFYPKEPSNDAECAFYAGKNYHLLIPFVEHVSQYLSKRGKIILIFSSDGNVGALLNLFAQHGYTINLVLREKSFFETFFIYEFSRFCITIPT